MIIDDLVGSWVGTNGFRLMPEDPLAGLPATAEVRLVAGGQLGLLTYGWQHPDDGPQDGVLLVALTGLDDGAVVTWADSWHQKPAPMTLTGRLTTEYDVAAEYAEGWTWRIRLGTGPAGGLRMQMDNVLPSSHPNPGPYPVMVLEARRA